MFVERGDERLDDLPVRTIGYWLTGLGFLQIGHAVVRGLEELVHEDPDVIHVPLWTVVLSLATTAALLWAGRGVREGRPGARAFAALFIVGWVGATILAINSNSLSSYGHVAAARDGVWRASNWPVMLGCLERFTWGPTGAWRHPEFLAAAIFDVVGVAMICLLVRPIGLTPVEGETREARVARRQAALRRGEANPSLGASLLRAVLALHVAFIAILMVIVLVGLSARVAGWKIGK